MISVPFFHSSWTDAVALPILLFSLSAVVRNLSKFAARAAVSEFFFLGISTALSRPSPKFLDSCFKLSHTRVNFCAASSNTFPGHEEGAAKHLGRLPPLLSFFSASFSTGQPRSFRSASSTACARKRSFLLLVS